jgi:pimeloyl-ACP methyl ester carboxylesterase
MEHCDHALELHRGEVVLMREAAVTLADGRVLSYAEHGDPDGSPILYNHPLPGARNFTLEAPALRTAGAQCFTVERPGIGLSTRAPARTLTDWPADVAEFADALGLERFAVVGVSAGGSYALALAHALPDRVSRVGLVCALGPILEHPEFDDDFNHPLRALLPVARQDADAAEALLREFLTPLGERYRTDPETFFEEWLQGWPEDQQVLYRKYKSRWMPAIEATHRDTDGYADDIVSGLHWTFDPGEIHTPVRSWHGTADQAAPFGLTRLVVEQAGGELVPYEGLGHYLGPEYHNEWAAWLVDTS